MFVYSSQGVAALLPLYISRYPFRLHTATEAEIIDVRDPTQICVDDIVHVPRDGSTFLHEAKVIHAAPRAGTVTVTYTTNK